MTKVAVSRQKFADIVRSAEPQLKSGCHRLATQIDGFAVRADQAEARTDSLRARVGVLQRERDTARAEAEEAAAELRRADADAPRCFHPITFMHGIDTDYAE